MNRLSDRRRDRPDPSGRLRSVRRRAPPAAQRHAGRRDRGVDRRGSRASHSSRSSTWCSVSGASSARRSGGSSASSIAYALLVRDRSDTETAIDRVMTVSIWASGAVVTAVLAWMIVYLTVEGTARAAARFLHDRSQQGRPAQPGRRCQARDHRDLRAGRHRDRHRGADRSAHGDLPERDPGPARACRCASSSTR